MIDLFRKIIAILTPRERWQLAGLAVLSLVVATLQTAGIGSILPFLALLSGSTLTPGTEFIRSMVGQVVGSDDPRTVAVAVGVLSLVLIIVSNGCVSVTVLLVTRFSWDNQARLSGTLLRGYLLQPYVRFLNRNSADVAKNVLSETQQFASGVVKSLLMATTYGAIVLFIGGFLAWYNPVLALVIGGTFAAIYSVLYLAIRNAMVRLGHVRAAAETERFRFVTEALGSIKESKVLGRELAFAARFAGPALRFARGVGHEQLLREMPRFAVETVGFGSLMLLVLYLIQTGGDVESVIPVVGMYAFAAYRVLPAMNMVYNAFGGMRYHVVVVDTLYRDLFEQDKDGPPPEAESAASTAPEAISFTTALELRDVSFTYPNAPAPALNGISLRIPKGSFVAIIGQTGSGKTTLIDIVLGLLTPDHGAMLVDGQPLHSRNLRSWQNRLGYVPQDIYLIDDTVAANIALGVPSAQIDRAAVEEAARIANIHDFVVDRLPQGYDTQVGERGVRLSGGERQRIGIARALYHRPDLVVLDEATSNLDQATEASVRRAIEQTAAAKTVIMIAHRLSTTQNCDRLFIMERGRFVDQGTYGELLASSSSFQTMVGA